jgi:hypothetical protein
MSRVVVQADDVFTKSFIRKLKSLGLEMVDASTKEIFEFDDATGRVSAVLVRARDAKSYRRLTKEKYFIPGGDGALAWIDIPGPQEMGYDEFNKHINPEYRGLPSESGGQGRLKSDAEGLIYGSGWKEEDSAVPEFSSHSEEEVGMSPAMPEDQEEDSALDDNIKNKEDWPAHLDVTITSSLKFYALRDWLLKSGHKEEAEYLRKITAY